MLKPVSSPTFLRILNNCLSGSSKKIFPNQVVFYNAVFGATNPALMPEEFLDDMNRIGLGERRPQDEGLIKQVNYLLRCGLDSNSANVGKHINNVPELPIPKQHRAHYLDQENRNDIVRRLQAVIRFCLAFHPERFRLKEEDFAGLLAQMKGELSEASPTLSGTDKLSVETLGNVVYEVLVSHLSRIQEPCFSIPEKEKRKKVDLISQYEEYMTKIACFRNSNADRFFAMRCLAENNVIAANELACVYYYGGQYYEMGEGEGSNGVYRVEPDPDKAALYFKKAADCDPPVISACWSLGYMIWNRMYAGIPEEEAESLAFWYFNYALEHEYMPAYNSVGMIELAKGDALLEEEQQRKRQGLALTKEDHEEMLAHYCRGLELCDRAGCGGWVYGHINVANFMADERYTDMVLPEIRGKARLEGPWDLRKRWSAAAGLGNLWAMNQLALLDCRAGDITSAVEIWEKASGYHYPAASLNLALCVYGEGCPRQDAERYRQCLERASADGSARASLELAGLYAPVNKEKEKRLLELAGKQNDQKDRDGLYRQIGGIRPEAKIKGVW